MKTIKLGFKTTIFALLLTFLTAVASARGTFNGGGGGPSVVCRDEKKVITSAKTFDLYEGKNWFSLTIPESEDSVADQLRGVIKKLSFNFAIQHDFVETLHQLLSNRKFHSKLFAIATADLGKSRPLLIDEGCELLYAGFYDSQGTLNISQPVYSEFSATDIAAFYTHEAIYKMMRKYVDNLASSEDARAITAHLFSDPYDSQFILENSNLLTWSPQGNWAKRHYKEALWYRPIIVDQEGGVFTSRSSSAKLSAGFWCWQGHSLVRGMDKSMNETDCDRIALSYTAASSSNPIQIELLYDGKVVESFKTRQVWPRQVEHFSYIIPVYVKARYEKIKQKLEPLLSGL